MKQNLSILSCVYTSEPTVLLVSRFPFIKINPYMSREKLCSDRLDDVRQKASKTPLLRLEYKVLQYLWRSPGAVISMDYFQSDEALQE